MTRSRITFSLKGSQEKERRAENLFQTLMAKNFPNLLKETDIWVRREPQKFPNKMNPKRTKPGHIKIKMVKVKDRERISKAAREKRLLQ